MVSELLDAGPGRLPVCARLAWWGTAWLRGLVVTDQVLDEVPGTGLLDALLECRRRGARGLALAWPLPGHPIGLAGPPDLNTVVLGHGQAVVAVQAEVCVVPVAGEDGVHWEALRAHPAPVLDLAEADRDLRHGIVAAATELAELDVARWRPELADELHELGAPMPVSAPPGVPPRAAAVAARALLADRICALAAVDDGAAVSAVEQRLRGESLQRLAVTARQALVAACCPGGWPDLSV